MVITRVHSMSWKPLIWAITDHDGDVVAVFAEERFARSFFQSNHNLGLEQVCKVEIR